MNAPKPISVTVPNTDTSGRAMKKLLAAGIPAYLETRHNGARLRRVMAVEDGTLAVENFGPMNSRGFHRYTWTPPTPPAPADSDLAAVRRKLAAETLHADEGWRRYEAANQARNRAEAELARRPPFQVNDAERFVIVASMLSAAYYAARSEITDPVHLALHRIVAEEPPTAPAPEYWRKVIDRAVAEAGGAR